MSKKRIKKSASYVAINVFLSVFLLFTSSCLIAGEEDEAELIENLLQKVDAMDGEMTVVTEGGDNVTITITKGSSTDGQDDIPKDEPKNTDVGKDSSSPVNLSGILPSFERVEDVFEVLGVGKDAHILREKGLSWSHIAAELGYGEDMMHAELLEIAEWRLKDAMESGLITRETLEKKFAYFKEIALKWVDKIFADTYEKEEEPQAEETVKLEGTIKHIDGHIWKVIEEDKIWLVNVSEAEIIREPAVGLRAFIAGIEKGDMLIALEVEIEVVEKEDKIIDFDGIIKHIDGHIWKVKVEDEIWVVDVSEASIRAEPDIGQNVVVAGILGDDIIIALEIDEVEGKY
jgi:hypothetical protein